MNQDADIERKRKLIQNERVFKAANELISERVDPEDADRRVPFLCECSNPKCTERVALTLAEWSRIHEHDEQFVIRPGHETAEVDRLTEADPDYHIVRKKRAA